MASVSLMTAQRGAASGPNHTSVRPLVNPVPRTVTGVPATAWAGSAAATENGSRVTVEGAKP